MKNQSKIIGAVALITLLGVATWVARSGSGPTDELGDKSAHRVAPSFELADFSGKVRRLDEFKGQTTVIHFWASWCPPCLAEIPEWLEFTRKFQGKPVKFLALSLDKNWKDARKILNDKTLPPNVISLLDVEGRVSDQYGSYSFPETYILNSNHEISLKLVGPQKWSAPELSERLEDILKRPNL